MSGRELHDFLISIHALREEGDVARFGLLDFVKGFLSTPSARRATLRWLMMIQLISISIHALREEGDCYHIKVHVCLHNFYPRPPRGGRLF